jgi:glutaminyl-peptide cyclotransferase
MKFILIFISVIFLGCTPGGKSSTNDALLLPQLSPVDGEAAMALVRRQLEFGARQVNSEAAEKCANFIADFGRKLGYEVKIDIWSEGSGKDSLVFRNIICTKKGQGTQKVVCGSHYDTKILAEYPTFTGANDGASSTALLLHLMELIAKSDQWQNHCTMQFVFFDGEEAVVEYTDTDGLNGSRRFVRNMYMNGENTSCRAMLLLDMVGDKDFKLTIPSNSTDWLMRKTTAIAEKLNLSKYVTELDAPGFWDDHIPFLQAGIPAIDFIDFEYGLKTATNGGGAYWHTAEDTIDKLSSESLKVCGTIFIHLLWQVSLNPIIKKP